MIVVSDTTPLRHLVAIGQVHLLQQLFGRVVVPETVIRELRAEKTPAIVTDWLRQLPQWLVVRTGLERKLSATDNGLDPGELEAIEIALDLASDLILLDDSHARKFALGLGLPVTGTLGVLERADVSGLLPDLPGTLARLEASGFYLSSRLRESMLMRYRSRKR